MQLNKEKVQKDLEEFITEYQKSLWASNTMKYDHIIPIITINDLIYKLNYKCSLKEFKDFISQYDDLKTLINDFVANNYVHYCSSVKLKELLQEYKEANIIIERDNFEFDISTLTTYNDIGIKLDKPISINSSLLSDLNEQQTEEILKDVNKFND